MGQFVNNYTNTKKELDLINAEFNGIFKFYLEQQENTYIADSCEEFYYGGFCFETIMDRITDAVVKDHGELAYLDCVCPGRWVISL